VGDILRVISGTYKGRKLITLPGAHTRPTTDKVKEAVFSSLQSVVPGSTWLDLFAGSGSIGIEALSRGAKFVWFVERDKRAAEIVRTNLKALGIDQDRSRLIFNDAESACRIIAKEAGQALDVVYIDPPYANRRIYVKIITALAGLIVPGGLIIIEHDKNYMPTGENLMKLRSRSYGMTVVTIFQYGKGE
jgi:16S rRNA (guanine966-N2)-methyltransferase